MLRAKQWLTLLVLGALLISACQPIQAPEAGAQAPTFKVEVLAKGAPIPGANGLSFGPDGNLYIGSVGGRAIIVMNPETGAILKRMGPDNGVEGADDLIFGPDGTLYWTALMTGEVGRMTPAGAKTTQKVALGVNPITFSKDGRMFVALDFLGDGLYELDPTFVKPPRLLAEKLGFLNAFAFGPDGYLYGPIYTQGKLVRIDVNANPVKIETFANGFGIPVAVKFDAQGRLHALDQATGEVMRIDLKTKVKTVLATLPPGLDNLTFDAHGRLFVSHANAGTIFEVKADGTARTVSPGGMTGTGGVAVVQKNGGETVYVSSVFTLHEFDAQTGKPMGVTGLDTLTVAPDGTNLLLSSWFANVISIWDPATHKTVALYKDFAVPINAIRFQGDLIVAELGTHSVVRAKGADPTQRTPLATQLGVPTGLAATENELWVSDFATGKVLQLVAAGKVLAEPKVIATGLVTPEGLALTKDGQLLVVESGAHRLSAIDLATGQVTSLVTGLGLGMAGPPSVPPPWTFNGVAVSPAGTIYVNGDIDNVLYRITTID